MHADRVEQDVSEAFANWNGDMWRDFSRLRGAMSLNGHGGARAITSSRLRQLGKAVFHQLTGYGGRRHSCARGLGYILVNHPDFELRRRTWGALGTAGGTRR